MPVAEQIAVLYCGVHNLLAGITVDKVPEFENLFLEAMRSENNGAALDVLSQGIIDEEVAKTIESTAARIAETLK